MRRNNNFVNFAGILRYIPNAVAMVQGGEIYPDIGGSVRLYDTAYGTVVFAEIVGLPLGQVGEERSFGFCICSGDSCSERLTSLSGSGGIAFLAFLTDRFRVEDIIGRTVVIYDCPNDPASLSAGNAGVKIACGEIVAVRR